jgi:glycosyltransferase involved in cell wall biosynthesis
MGATLNVALITEGDPGRLTGGYLYHRRIAALAPAHGARIEFVSVPRRPFPLSVVDARSVIARVRVLRADVMLLDSIAAAAVGPWLALNEPPAPLVGMLHQTPGGIDFGPLRTALQARLDRLAWQRATRLLVASDALADALVARGFARASVQVIPPGRDVAPDPDVPSDDLRQGRLAAFLCVGNWVERKGILSLLDSFALLPQDTGTLHLAGDEHRDTGYGRRVLRRLAMPDLAGRVVRHGALPVAKVAGLYSAADVFVLPSLKEPYGTVIGEAMAFGLPVVGWRAGNLPHLADDGVEALIVPPGDLDALARSLRRLAVDQTLRQQMGEAARRRAGSRPTWEDSAGSLFQALRNVVNGR